MIFLDENKKVDFITDKWISLRTSGFVNPLVRRTSRFFDEIRALGVYTNKIHNHVGPMVCIIRPQNIRNSMGPMGLFVLHDFQFFCSSET